MSLISLGSNPGTMRSNSRAVLLRLAFTLVALVAAGFVSNALSSTACERETKRWAEACYVRLAPAHAPALNWIEPGPLDQLPNPTLNGEKPVYLSLRAWLFSPRVVFDQRERPRYQPGFQSYAYTVRRAPLPFMSRVHYLWQFMEPVPAPDSRSKMVTVMWGASTYFCLFGTVVTLDQSQPPCPAAS